ncbi:MAG: type II secretion system F family protein [Pseudomonadota bacterium]
MAAFDYLALDDGRNVKGVLQADSARQARQQLRDRGWVPLQVEAIAAERVAKAGRAAGAGLGRERALILRQLAALLAAGLPLEEVLGMLSEQTGRSKTKRPMAAIRSRVVEGASLSDAMAEQPALFPPLFYRSVAAGEQAGQLDLVVARLADHAEKTQALSRNLLVALVYPVLLALISVAVIWGLLAFVVPRVVSVFEQASQQLPWMTQSLILISSGLANYGLWVLLGLAALTVLTIVLFKQPGPRLVVDTGLLKLPLIGRLVRTHASALFARTFAMLVSSAVPAVEALQAASLVINNRRVQLDLNQAAARVREGASISASLEDIDWLPPLTRRLIQGGEQAGDLALMMDHAAALQEADLADSAQVLLSVIQPLLILMVGLVVLYIVLAILLPILNLSQLLA